MYSEIVPRTMPVAEMLAKKPKAIIFSGGPASVHVDGAPSIDPAVYDAGVPILGICYGAQLVARDLGGDRRAHRERRVRPHRDDARRGRPVGAVHRPARRAGGLDEPRRLDRRARPRGSWSRRRPRRCPSRPSRTPSARSTACSSTPRSRTRRGARRSSRRSSSTARTAGRRGRTRRSSSSRSPRSARRSAPSA